MEDVTRILDALEAGDPSAASHLLPVVYDELRRLAAQRLRQERAGQTLEPTALVHESYVRLVGKDHKEIHWDGRGHFFAAAAEAMRRILVERARRKARQKRGCNSHQVDLDRLELANEDRAADLIAIDEALEALEQHDAQASQLVKLRFFAGLTHQETADVLGITRRAADRLWLLARAWLYQSLREE